MLIEDRWVTWMIWWAGPNPNRLLEHTGLCPVDSVSCRRSLDKVVERIGQGPSRRCFRINI